MTARRQKPAPARRQHEPAIEALIALTQELLDMDRRSGDGVAFNPWDREGLHQRVNDAIAAVRAPVTTTSKLRTVADGRKLAVTMLRHLERIDPDAANVYLYDAYTDDDEEGRLVWRQGPQVDLLGDYLRQIGDASEAREGFTRVLTDFIATAVAQGSVVASFDYDHPPRGPSELAAEGARP